MTYFLFDFTLFILMVFFVVTLYFHLPPFLILYANWYFTPPLTFLNFTETVLDIFKLKWTDEISDKSLPTLMLAAGVFQYFHENVGLSNYMTYY